MAATQARAKGRAEGMIIVSGDADGLAENVATEGAELREVR